MNPDAIPELRTERLVLRAPRVSDYEASAALWSDPAVVRHIGGRVFTSEEIWGRLLRYVGHWALLGFGSWIIEEAATGKPVGEVGLFIGRRTIEPPLGDAPELGWVISPAHQGRGYGGEAVAAALAWADARWDRRRTVCLIHPDNTPSLRLAARCGFTEYARADYQGAPAILFERL